MVLPLEQTALMLYLQQKNVSYYSKLLEVRDSVRGWLAYIPHTFPHYTRHTIEHSEEIIRQVSFVIFRDGDVTRPEITTISAVELYVLAAAAFFHDAGMVASDSEKRRIIESPDWKSWITTGGGAKRWAEIQSLRAGGVPADEPTRNFLADVQMRFLIAEFIRRIHHLRAGTIITEHQASLGRFAFDDPELIRTIADVCAGHGLRQHELEDRVRFPDRRNIRGETINVRFVAILLRLGDLLDMSFDRACPLLLNAACPLPPDSYAHWSQYHGIHHRLTAPDRIEVEASCNTQDEHRVLHDWCTWIATEAATSGIAMMRSKRHTNWKPPFVSLDGTDASIIIKPAEGATYFPSEWMFELDRDAVFERLIRDAYEEPAVFIRELLQNAADASRCKLYMDANCSDSELPEYPTQFAEEERDRYPIRIDLAEVKRTNPLSGELETRQKLVIDDAGIGMDEEVIRRYFLQVGRSFYATDDFRRSFHFTPTSRFGVGFLSTFAVSDDILVETYKPSSSSGAIRLRLRGPRSYLLTERGERRTAGTRIEVLLTQKLGPEQLTELLTGWCKRLEFPVLVNDLGRCTTIRPERSEIFVAEVPDISTPDSTFAIRSFPVNRPGIEGDLYVFARVSKNRESWINYSWAAYTYVPAYPQAEIPVVPPPSICFHGIQIESAPSANAGFSERVDYRGRQHKPNLSRSGLIGRARTTDPALTERWDELIAEHLSNIDPNDWYYRQRLLAEVGSLGFWRSLPRTLRIYKRGEQCLLSMAEAEALPVVATVVDPAEATNKQAIEAKDIEWDHDIPTFTESDLLRVDGRYREQFFARRKPDAVRLIGPRYAAVTWSLINEPAIIDSGRVAFAFVEMPWTELLGLPMPLQKYRSVHLINTRHPYGAWIAAVYDASRTSVDGITKSQFQRLIEWFDSALSYGGHKAPELAKFIDGWRRIAGLSPHLYPPALEVDRGLFQAWTRVAGCPARPPGRA
jgi:molecular chaperone HtpG